MAAGSKEERDTLFHLVSTNDAYRLKLYIDKLGFNPRTRGKNGTTLLIRAIELGSFDCARFLIKKGNTLSAARLTDGVTAMHMAVILRDAFPILELLLTTRTPLNIRDRIGLTPLKTAELAMHRDAVALLKAHSAHETPITAADCAAADAGSLTLTNDS